MFRILTVILMFLVVGVVGRVIAETVPKGIDLASLEGWDIVIAADAIESENYAAEEFQNYYLQAAGVKLPINRDVGGSDRHIFIGSGSAMQSSTVGFSVDTFDLEDLRIIIDDNNIAIAGGRPRGTLYGVYTFLEDYMGIRFLTVDHIHVPAIGSRRLIGQVDRFYHPPLNFRWTFYQANRFNPEFATRMRTNTLPGSHKHTWRYPGIPKLGGKTGITLASHSFRYQIPPKTYADAHPEYYALYKGERLATLRPGDKTNYHFSGGFVYGMQPCLTHPDVLKIVTKSVIEEAKAHPEIVNISVSQDDGGAFCQCPNCEVIIKKEGFSGYVLQFVNQVADALAKECPGKMVATLAYSDTLAPPRTIKLRPNVQIWFTTINMCGNHDLDDPTCTDSKKYINNVVYSTYLKQWNSICENLYVWDYIANFEYTNYQLPVANFESMEKKTRYLIANGVKGIFMQATASSQGNELEDLRNYVASNLLWDPTRSSQTLMKEFLDLHLGNSGKPILDWINAMVKQTKASGTHCRCVGGRWEEYGLDQAMALKGLDAFDQAMKLAENDAIRTRVEKMSIAAYRAAIEPIWYIKYTETDVPWMMSEHKSDETKANKQLASEMRPYAKRFFELCTKFGVERTGEGEKRNIKVAHERLESLLGDL